MARMMRKRRFKRTPTRRKRVQSFPTYRRPVAESKYVDTEMGVTINTTVTGTLLNGVATGTGDFGRIGNTIQLKYVQLRLWFNQTAGVAVSQRNDYVRVIVVYDQQCNGAIPVLATVLQDTSSTGANTANCFSFSNTDTKRRFKMLFDRTFYLPPVGVLTTSLSTLGGVEEGAGLLRINKFIKLRNLTTRFIGSTDAIGDMETGSLVIYTQSIGNTGSATSLQGAIRLCYNDR